MRRKKKKVWIIVVAILVLAALYGIGSKNSKEEVAAPTNDTKQEQQIADNKEQTTSEPTKEKEKQPEVTPEKEPANETPEPAKETEDLATNNDGIRQELKDFLDSYEAVMDEYCDFMKSYNPSDLSMLSRYTTILQKYTDFAAKADAWKGQDLNNKELIYYTEVTTRVATKLLEVSQGMLQ